MYLAVTCHLHFCTSGCFTCYCGSTSFLPQIARTDPDGTRWGARGAPLLTSFLLILVVGGAPLLTSFLLILVVGGAPLLTSFLLILVVGGAPLLTSFLLILVVGGAPLLTSFLLILVVGGAACTAAVFCGNASWLDQGSRRKVRMHADTNFSAGSLKI